jgi:hypothetical protein
MPVHPLPIFFNNNKINVRETQGAINNGKSRETGHIGHIRHKKETNKTKNTTQYLLDTTMRRQHK